MLQEEFSKVEEMAGHFKTYLNTKIDQVKFGVAEKTSTLISVIIAGLLIGLLFFMFIFFTSIAAALFLGEWLQNRWMGFLIVAAIYLFICLIIWVARERLLRLPIMNAMIKQLFTNDENDEEDKK